MEGTWNARLFSLACGAALAAGSVVAVRSAYAASLTVPTNQFVTVELSETLTSATAHVGDTFGFVTTRDEMLGSLAVPKGTPGHGRLADVRIAQGKDPGVIALQADSIDLPDGDTVWVNIDTNNPPHGRLADKHTRLLLPLPILESSATGNMILDRGVTFNVYTIPPRASPAPLLTATPGPPSPVPTPAPPQAPVPSTPTPTPSPTPTATPES